MQPFHYILLFNRLLLVFGATSASNILIEWHRVQPAEEGTADWPLARTGGATWTESGGDAWLFGGRAVEPRAEVFGDLWVFRSRQRAWQQFTPLPGRGRQGAALCGLANKALVVEGGTEEDGAAAKNTAVFDFANDSWRFLGCDRLFFHVDDEVLDEALLNATNVSSTTTSTTTTTTRPTSQQPCPTLSRKDSVAWCSSNALWVANGGSDDAWSVQLPVGRWERHSGPTTSPGDVAVLSARSRRLLKWSDGDRGPPVVWFTDANNNNGTEHVHQLWTYGEGEGWSLLDQTSVTSSTPSIISSSSSNNNNNNKNNGAEEEEEKEESPPWPKARTGAATWTDAFGNPWLFGGEDLVSGRLLDDAWMYSVQANVWIRANDLHTDAAADDKDKDKNSRPSARAGAFAWSTQQTAFIFGGHSLCDSIATGTTKHNKKLVPGKEEEEEDDKRKSKTAAECVWNDLWELRVSYGGRQRVTAATSTADPTLRHARPSNGGDKGAEKAARTPWADTERGDVFGSVLFFGLSLSFFAVFGVMLFVRRCVSCPPREHALLKEPPPVRYTVIPDDACAA